MSEPCVPKRAVLFSSVIYGAESALAAVLGELRAVFGPISFESRELDFSGTDYYETEMGKSLKRVFVAFENTVGREEISGIKLKTNGIEKSFSRDGSRTVNIDPGLVTLENVVLATGKNYSHRIYLAKGIYAEVTLVFKKGGFEPLEWTYPDYSSGEIRQIFGNIREKYKKLLRCEDA